MKTLRIILITFTPCFAAFCSATDQAVLTKSLVAIGEKAATKALEEWIDENAK